MSFTLLGILNAQAAGGGAAEAFDLLESFTVPSGTDSQIDFDGLVSTYSADYTHLQVRGVVLTGTGNYIGIRFNDDTANYRGHYMESANPPDSFRSLFNTLNAGVTYNTTHGGFICDILDPFNTGKGTTIRSLSAHSSNHCGIFAAAWTPTTAVDKISILEQYGGNYAATTRFSLYGLRKAA